MHDYCKIAAPVVRFHSLRGYNFDNWGPIEKNFPVGIAVTSYLREGKRLKISLSYLYLGML